MSSWRKKPATSSRKNTNQKDSFGDEITSEEIKKKNNQEETRKKRRNSAGEVACWDAVG
jgi:hypothetical protein